ncbi:MAG: hypothetical protein ACR2RV_00530 [Verrucomicrobiales bacterium]
MRNVPGLEAVYRDYKDKGVEFFYVYKALAHPQKDGYVEPFDITERLMHVEEAKRRLDTKIPWLCDSQSNSLKHAFGDRNNSEFVIGADGLIAVARAWSDPDTLREDLERLVGASEKRTSIEDLGRRPQPAPKVAARGVVPRIERPSNLVPVKSKPIRGREEAPYYVKLRAEVEGEVLDGGSGKMLIGFHLDPLYHVHWNNLAAPVKFSIEAPDGISITPASGVGPQPEQESDIDPREFIVSLEGGDARKLLRLTVDYFACNDDEGWCKPVSQKYEIVLSRDRDAGRVTSGRGRGGRRPGGGAGDRAGGGGGGFRPGAEQILKRILESDADGDGKLSREEAPERMKDRFDTMDSNGDGFIEKAEIEARFANGLPGAGPDRRSRERQPRRPQPENDADAD